MNLADLIKDGWEVHYAPIPGSIAVTRGDETRKATTWPEHHELMRASASPTSSST